MNKSDFYYEDGSSFLGIFREINLSGIQVKGYKAPVYTLNEEDDDLPSAHKIYMNSLNEYDAAMKLVPTWAFWLNMLETSKKIKLVVEKWREEKYQMDQASARALLWDAARKGNVSAQKILYDARKEEKAQELARKQEKSELQKESSLIQERYARLTELKLAK